ncbi:MAG: DUF4350 domain-containing protein, partial [Vicinamibacterales bacterium]
MPRQLRLIIDSIFFVLLAALVVAGVLIGLGIWDPKIGPGAPHSSYSTAAAGKKAFYLLTAERLFDPRRSNRPLRLLTERLRSEYRRTAILILGPVRYPSEAQWKDLLDYVSAGGVLVFAVRDDEFDSDDAPLKIPGLDAEVTPIWDDVPYPEADLGDTRGGYVATSLLRDPNLYWQSRGQLVAPKAETLVAFDGTVQAARMEYGSGQVVLLASDFVFSNQSIDYGDNSVLAVRLLESAGPLDEIYFDESLNTTPMVIG